MRRIFNILLIMCSCSVFAQSDSGQKINEYISTDLKLSKGLYHVDNNVVVTKGASLTIEPGTEIVFAPGTSILVKGGLQINGSATEHVMLRSEDSEQPGKGFIVDGNANERISISFSDFKNLNVPLHLMPNWYRSDVTVTNSSFSGIYSGEPAIIVRNADELITGKTSTFRFVKNEFIGNMANIFIQDYDSDIVKLIFKNNLITENYSEGIEVSGMYHAPLYTSFSGKGKRFTGEINGNAIFNNYMMNADTVVQVINVAVAGLGDKVDLTGNYFGYSDFKAATATVDNFTNNVALPFAVIKPMADEPSGLVGSHIWKIRMNGEDVNSFDPLPTSSGTTADLALYFNAGVSKSKNPTMMYHYYGNNGEMISSNITVGNGTWNKNQVNYSLNASELMSGEGYITVAGFQSENGQDVPEITIGRIEADRRTIRKTPQVKDPEYTVTSAEDIDARFKALTDSLSALTMRMEEMKAGAADKDRLRVNWFESYDIGVTAFGTLYWGEMAEDQINSILQEPGKGGGVTLGANFNKRWGLEGSVRFYNVVADARTIKEAKRRSQFKTDVLEASFMARWFAITGEKYDVRLTLGGVGLLRNTYLRGRSGGFTDQTKSGFDRVAAGVAGGLTIRRHINDVWAIEGNGRLTYLLIDDIDGWTEKDSIKDIIIMGGFTLVRKF